MCLNAIGDLIDIRGSKIHQSPFKILAVIVVLLEVVLKSLIWI